MDERPSALFGGGFAAHYGLELLSLDDDGMRARVAVRDELKQPAGLIDGGVYAAMAENMASAGTYVAVRRAGQIAMGQANHTSYMRPITEGHVNALARPRHRGRTTWVWEVEFLDDSQRLCALSRVTVAVRQPR